MDKVNSPLEDLILLTLFVARQLGLRQAMQCE
jgi:hypothetical protein